MAQITATAPPKLPRPIRRALGRIDRRLRWNSALIALGTILFVASIGAAAGMSADFFWVMPSWARWAFWVSWMAAIAAVSLYGIVRVFGRRASAIELAAVIERGDPEARERLTGAVGLLGEHAHGSPALIAALLEDASEHMSGIDFEMAAPSDKGWKRLACGVAAAGIVVAPPLFNADPCGQLAKRFLMPWADLDRASRFVVEVVPGDTVLAMGEDLPVIARVVPRFGGEDPEGTAELEWTDASGKIRRKAMTGINKLEDWKTSRYPIVQPPAPGTLIFEGVLPKLYGKMAYRVVSRSTESRRYTATAIAPPTVVAVSAKMEPPAYTKMPATVVQDATRLVAFEGSKVTLTATTDVAVTSAELTWPGAASPLPMAVSSDGTSLSANVTASTTGDYTIKLKESHGLTSGIESPRRVVVRPDAPPVIAMKGPEEAEQARDDDTLRVAIAAKDDVAVASVELHYTVERARDAEDSEKERGEVPAKFDGLNNSSARGEIALGLKPLKLTPGDVVAYRVRVADNRPAPKGPNVVWSTPRRLTIAEGVAPLWSRQNQAERDALKTTIENMKKEAVENRQQTEQLRYAADAVLRGNGEWDRDRKQALAARELEARALAEKLDAFANDLEDDPTFQPLSRPARQISKVEVDAARATLDHARQANDPSQRLAELRLADTRLAAVVSRLDELQRQFNEIAGRDDDRRRLQDLADRQDQVVAHAEADGPPDRARLDQLEAEQNRVKADLDAMLKQSPTMKAEVLDAQAKQADALARRAREIADLQREEARKAVDLSKQVDAFKKLAEEQRAIEDAARRLALDADAPLAENGRGRVNTDLIKHAADPLERGEIDPSRRQLSAAELELRRLARELDEVPEDLKALAQRLASSQDQLANEIIEALGESRNKPKLTDEEKQAVAKKLAPLAERQKAIAGLVSAMLETKDAKSDKNPKFPVDSARSALEAAQKAAEADRDPANAREVEALVNNARNTMQRLAGAVPAYWQRNEAMRRAITQAREPAQHAAREIDQHLRETERLLEKEPARAAIDLAAKLNTALERAKEAAKKFADMDIPARFDPHRERAEKRAKALAEIVNSVREQAPKDPSDPGFDAAHAKALRNALRNAVIESHTAIDRLELKITHQSAADDVAAELLDEQRMLNQRNANIDQKELVAERRRIATALRTLPIPDAPLEQAEAVQAAERAIDGKEAERMAADKAVTALAKRLNAKETPKDRVEALARAERTLNDVDSTEALRRRRVIAAELARLPRNEAGVRAAEEAVKKANEQAAHTEETAPGRGKADLEAQRIADENAAKALDALAAKLDKSTPEQSKIASKSDTPRDAGLMLSLIHI